jgi:hypothetical protein
MYGSNENCQPNMRPHRQPVILKHEDCRFHTALPEWYGSLLEDQDVLESSLEFSEPFLYKSFF